MKKTYFVVIALLLAMVLVGCDSVVEQIVEEEAESAAFQALTFDSEGKAYISVQLGEPDVRSARALTTAIAAAGADYFEVVFDNGARKVRTSWGNGATGRIIPGDGDYDNTDLGDHDGSNATPDKGKAYIFAGRNGTLLGIGVLVNVIEGATQTNATLIDITKATEVVFEITALNTDVGGTKAAADAYDTTYTTEFGSNGGDADLADAAAKIAAKAATINSTFKIPVGGLNPFSQANVGSLLLDASQTPNLTAPVFLVDPGTTAIAATFDITDTNGNSFGMVDPVTGDPSDPAQILYEHLADIKSAIIPVASSVALPVVDLINKVTCTGYLWEAGNSPFAQTKGATVGITVGGPFTIPIPLSIIPESKPGLAQVSIEIPVYLYDDGSTPAANGAAPLTWYIRGGLNNTAADLGATFNGGDGSLGGAIIIGVGEFNKNAAGLIISSRTAP